MRHCRYRMSAKRLYIRLMAGKPAYGVLRGKVNLHFALIA